MTTSNDLDRDSAGKLFLAGLARFDPARPLTILGHFDADGLSATAILARALKRVGRTVSVRLVGKGENPWSTSIREEMEEQAPGGLIVTDLGVREGAIAPGIPTILIDHHVPTGVAGDAVVISGNGVEPEPTSALLAFWCAESVTEAEDLLWLAALGLITTASPATPVGT